MSKHYVNVYFRDRAYGGPEEGGWWYDYGIFEYTEGVYNDEDQAVEVARQLNSEFGDPRLGSINGGGNRALVEDLPGKSWPAERPHYE